MNATGSEARNGHTGASSPQAGPFGYSFFPPDTPYDAGPAPPPGPALLDDSESTMLDNFFTTLNSSHLDTSDAWFGGQTQDKGAFGLEWPDELPPIFEGSTTSLSQPSFLPYSTSKRESDLMDNGMSTSSDILAAASMLYQNGIHTSGSGPTSTHHLFSNHALSGTNGAFSSASGFVKQERSDDHRAAEDSSPRSSRKRLLQGQHTEVFNVQEPVPLDPHTSAKVRTLRWGSDASFVDQGYMAPPDVPNEEERTKDLLHKLECLEPQTSTTNTRAPTPVRMFESVQRDWASLNGAHMPHVLQNGDRDNHDNSMPPKKRPKTKTKEEEDFDENGTHSRSKRPKSSSGSKARRASSENSSRKPSKPPRENLTEEQKRTNHILSEQKRRNLIKQGFDELCSLVPELRGGGFSKSAMLVHAAEWLEDILRGNELLKSQLAELKAMNGFIMSR
ncbi:hypothetical protein VTN77DRAFT_4856 [Rasamsonia byssochlamydoides]|uniref:uncharacterized protein n=1 Tax=Rasamsonia byssochlamydoides TaxID=89139 RepID=UPI003743A4D9